MSASLVATIRNALVIMAPILADDAPNNALIMTTPWMLDELKGDGWREIEEARDEIEQACKGTVDGVGVFAPDGGQPIMGVLIVSRESFDPLGGVTRENPLGPWFSYHLDGGTGAVVVHPESH